MKFLCVCTKSFLVNEEPFSAFEFADLKRKSFFQACNCLKTAAISFYWVNLSGETFKNLRKTIWFLSPVSPAHSPLLPFRNVELANLEFSDSI